MQEICAMRGCQSIAAYLIQLTESDAAELRSRRIPQASPLESLGEKAAPAVGVDDNYVHKRKRGATDAQRILHLRGQGVSVELIAVRLALSKSAIRSILQNYDAAAHHHPAVQVSPSRRRMKNISLPGSTPYPPR